MRISATDAEGVEVSPKRGRDIIQGVGTNELQHQDPGLENQRAVFPEIKYRRKNSNNSGTEVQLKWDKEPHNPAGVHNSASPVGKYSWVLEEDPIPHPPKPNNAGTARKVPPKSENSYGLALLEEHAAKNQLKG